MSVKLNNSGYDHARELALEGKFEFDEHDDWSEHQPSAEEENAFIEEYGWGAYAKWHLGVDDGEREETKGHYKFPYGDFNVVRGCGVLSAEVRAAQRDYYDIEVAAAHIHGIIDRAHAKTTTAR
jgi:hypothetical protein